MNEFKTMLWKEAREYLMMYGSGRRWLLNIAIYVGVLGIFLPLQMGRSMIESVGMLLWMWMPLLSVISLTADSIAGERERHTLETLLASRLPDHTIVLGKVTVVVAQAWLTMLLSATLAVFTVSLFKNDGEFVFYPPSVLIALLTIPLLGGVLLAAIGVLVSLHAESVRQAYMRMLVPMLLIAVVPGLAISRLPPTILARLYSPEFAQESMTNVVLLVVAVLIILDSILLYVTIQRFRRPHLLAG